MKQILVAVDKKKANFFYLMSCTESESNNELK